MTKLLLATAIVGLLSVGMAMIGYKDNYNYVITEIGAATSLDPLDADQTQNLPVARMLYATPLEIDGDDQLTSLVLDRFAYEPNTKTITWAVKSEVKYSDGSNLTVDDVAFAVSRMLYANPTFPAIEHIVGKDEWLKSSRPLQSLPKGISVNGNTIQIELSKNVPHPLFRFCLELFSIIPKKCVDLNSNKITCDNIPSSGRYVILKNEPRNISFGLRPELADLRIPKQIIFQYVSADALFASLDNIDDGAIVAGNESQYSIEALENLKTKGAIRYLPAARFTALLINPKQSAFNDAKCRLFFANQFRKEYQRFPIDKNTLESSLFTRLLPGYATSDELSAKLSPECLVKIKSEPINWGYVEKEENSLFVKVLRATLESMGVDVQAPTVLSNKKELAEAFASGRIAFMNGNSGFWAHDPSGDLQMLFTPNLHRALGFVSNDNTLQTKIRAVTNAPEDAKKYKDVNQYMYEQGLFNVYAHVRRFYFSKNSSQFKDGNLALTAPPPWQVFK